jgi:hypothetical protein
MAKREMERCGQTKGAFPIRPICDIALLVARVRIPAVQVHVSYLRLRGAYLAGPRCPAIFVQRNFRQLCDWQYLPRVRVTAAGDWVLRKMHSLSF